MAKLVITSGPDRGKEFPLGESQILGRLSRNAIPLRDTRCSRRHARLYRNQGRYFLVDLDSKNGTFVNGNRVHKTGITPGDEVLLGETYFTIEYDESDLAATPAAGPSGTPRAGPATVSPVRDAPRAVSDVPLRTSASFARTGRTGDNMTRTSLAWLRTDLAQVSGLYRTLVMVGFLLLTAGLAYLAYTLVAG